MALKRESTERGQPRNYLSGEHPLGDTGQVVLAFLFFLSWFTNPVKLKWTVWFNHSVAPGTRIPVGMALLAISGYLAAIGLYTVFVEHTEKPGVIRKRVFGLVRHPIYLSEILLYLGLLIINLSFASAVVCVIAVLFLHHISRHEERLLLVRFGEEYERYMREVPMWIPRWRKKR